MSFKRDMFISAYNRNVCDCEPEAVEDYFKYYDQDSLGKFIEDWGTGYYSHLTDHWLMWCDAWSGQEEECPKFEPAEEEV